MFQVLPQTETFRNSLNFTSTDRFWSDDNVWWN